MYDIECNGVSCIVSQWDWNEQQKISIEPATDTAVNIGTYTRPVWLKRMSNGITITTDSECNCGGTVFRFDHYFFQVDLDANCKMDRGLAIEARSTGLSPLYGPTFGLCGHLDSAGTTQFGFRTASEYSTAGRRRPFSWARCDGFDWCDFFSHSNWHEFMVGGFCGDQIVPLSNATAINTILTNVFSSNKMCQLFAPTGAQVSDYDAGSYSSFQALAADSPTVVQPIAAVSCKNIDMFYDSLASCQKALLDPKGMTTNEIQQRNSALVICMYDACNAQDVTVAISNTVAFRSSIVDVKWQTEEIVAIVVGCIVGLLLLLVVGVYLYRRHMHAQYQQVLEDFTQDLKNPIKNSW